MSSQYLIKFENKITNLIVNEIESVPFVSQVIDFSCIRDAAKTTDSDLDLMIIINEDKVASHSLKEFKSLITHLLEKYPSTLSHKIYILNNTLFADFLKIDVFPFKKFHDRIKKKLPKRTIHSIASFHEFSILDFFALLHYIIYEPNKEKEKKHLFRFLDNATVVSQYFQVKNSTKIEKLYKQVSHLEILSECQEILSLNASKINNKFQIENTARQQIIHSKVGGSILFTNRKIVKLLQLLILGKKIYKVVDLSILDYIEEITGTISAKNKTTKARKQLLQNWSKFYKKYDLFQIASIHFEIFLEKELHG